MLPLCPHCRWRVWYPGHHWRCALDMDEIERKCAEVIRETADTGKDPKRYACLVHHVGGARLATRQQVSPQHLLRRGWTTFVETLYCSGDLQAFAQYKPSLDDFRDHFPRAFPETDFSGPGLEAYRQLEFLRALEDGQSPEEQLYLEPDPEKDGYVLPGEQVVWRNSRIWHWGRFRIPWLSWLAVISIVWNGFLWLASNPWLDGIIDAIASNWNEIAVGIMTTFLFGPISGAILFIFVLNYIIEWSLGRLILTDRALYFRGWFVGRYAPFDGIHEVRDDKRALVVTLPPDNYWKFWVGGSHARWLARVMQALGNESRRETSQPPPVQETAKDGQSST